MPLFSTPTFAPLEGFPIVPDCYLSRFSSKDRVSHPTSRFFLILFTVDDVELAANANTFLTSMAAFAFLWPTCVYSPALSWVSVVSPRSPTVGAATPPSYLPKPHRCGLSSGVHLGIAVLLQSILADCGHHPGRSKPAASRLSFPFVGSQSPVETSPRSAHPSAPHVQHYYAESWPSVSKCLDLFGQVRTHGK